MNPHDPSWKQFIMTPISNPDSTASFRAKSLEDIDTMPPRRTGEPFRDYASRILR